MSVEEVASGQPEEVASSESTQEVKPITSGDNTVKYDTYRKTLSEAKRAKAQLTDLQSQLQDMQQNQLAAEGKKDELISSLQSRVTELDGKYKGAVGSFASGKALDAIVDEAVRLGCTSTGLLRKVVADKVGEFEFDDQFNPNTDQVKMLVEDIRKSEPVLFGKPAPNLAANNLNPANNTSDRQTKSIKNMDENELLSAFGNALSNERK